MRAVVLELYQEIVDGKSVAFDIRLPPKFVSDSTQYLCQHKVAPKLRHFRPLIYLPARRSALQRRRMTFPKAMRLQGYENSAQKDIYALVDPDGGRSRWLS